MSKNDAARIAVPTLQGIVAWLTEEAAIARAHGAPEDAPNRRLMLTLREVKALCSVQDRLTALEEAHRALQMRWEEHDAEVCPEDVGCVEYIKALTKRAEQAEAALAAQTQEIR